VDDMTEEQRGRNTTNTGKQGRLNL
jgi:hypothetical protein